MKEWWLAARGNPTFRLVVLIGVAVILADQATKLFILHGLQLPTNVDMNRAGRLVQGHMDLGPILDLTYVENRGVSFGLLAGGIMSRVFLSILAVGVAGFILHWAGRLHRRWAAIGAGLIVGGALGNAIDRVAYGYVVDFLDFSALMFPWQFNIADAAINLGVAALAYDAFFVSPKKAGAVTPSETTAHMAADEPGEREEDEPFPDGTSPPIRPGDQSPRSSE